MDVTAQQERIGLLAKALKEVLIVDGVLREDAEPNPSELLLAAEEYVEYHSVLKMQGTRK